MKISSDLLHVTANPTLDDGKTAAEPEQQTVSRILNTVAEVESGAPAGTTLPAQIVAQSTVAQFAHALRQPCGNCKYFDNVAFNHFLAQADHPAAPIHMRETINSMRAALLQTQNVQVNAMHTGGDGDMDVEHGLRVLGFCRALGEHAGEPIVVHPVSSCPPEVINESQPDGFFSPKDNSAETAGDRAYDAIMRRAQGKAP